MAPKKKVQTKYSAKKKSSCRKSPPSEQLSQKHPPKVKNINLCTNMVEKFVSARTPIAPTDNALKKECGNGPDIFQKLASELHATYLVCRLQSIQVKVPWQQSDFQSPSVPDKLVPERRVILDLKLRLGIEAKTRLSFDELSVANLASAFPDYLSLSWVFNGEYVPCVSLLGEAIPPIDTLLDYLHKRFESEEDLWSGLAKVSLPEAHIASTAREAADVLQAVQRAFGGSPTTGAPSLVMSPQPKKRARESDEAAVSTCRRWSQSASRAPSLDLPQELLDMLPDGKIVELESAMQQRKQDEAASEQLQRRLDLAKLMSLYDLVRSIFGSRLSFGGAKLVELLVEQNRFGDGADAVCRQLRHLVSIPASGLRTDPQISENNFSAVMFRFDAEACKRSEVSAACLSTLHR